MSDESDRRIGSRIPVEMWVEERSPEAIYFQRSANISTGGIYFDKTIPHPIGTVIDLAFTLPGDTEVLRVRGEIVNTSEIGQMGMGVKFTGLDAVARARIEGFVERQSARTAHE